MTRAETIDRRALAVERDALRRIGTLTGEGPSDAMFAAIAEELARIVDLETGATHHEMAGIVRFEGDELVVLAAWANGPPVPAEVGSRWPLQGDSVTVRVSQTGRPARHDGPYESGTGAIGDRAKAVGARSTVAVPIVVDGALWGAATVLSTGPEPLPADTEDRLAAFADVAATAISNAEARERSRRLADEQMALRRVATLVAERADLDAVAEAAVAASGSLMGAMAALMVRIEGEDLLRVIAAWTATGVTPEVVGGHWPIRGGLTERAIRSRSPEHVPDWSVNQGTDRPPVEEFWGAGSSVAVPVLVHGAVWGAVILHYELPEGFPLDTADRLRTFAELVAAAISDAQAREQVGRLADEQAALRRVATLVAQGAEPGVVSDAVIGEIGQILGADVAAIVDFEPDGLPIRSAWEREGDGSRLIGVRGPIEGSLSQRIRETGRPARVDEWDDESGPMAELMRGELGLHSSVGCPVLVGGEISGVVVVYSTRPYVFPDDTEARLQNFADLVTTAIANAEAGEEIRRLADEQATLRRVATFVAEHPPPEEVFDAVARAVEQLIGVGHARVLRYESDGTATVMATAGHVVELHPVGANMPMDSPTAGGLVLRTGKPARVDDFEHLEGELAAQLRSMGVRSAAGAPITVGGRLWGVILATSFGSRPLPDGTVARLTDFTELVTTAISNAQARADVRQLAEEQAALRRVATLVAQGADLDAVCNAVIAEIGLLHGADAARMVRYDGPGTMSPIATWCAKGEPRDLAEGPWELDGGLPSRIAESGRPDRIDDWDQVPGELGGYVRTVRGLKASVGTPISVDGRLWGAVMVHSRREHWSFPVDSETRLANFADLVTIAISNVQARGVVRRLADEQAALRRVATLVAQQPSPEEVFDLVAREVARLIGVEDAQLLRYEPDGAATVVAASGRTAELRRTGRRVDLDPQSAGAPISVDGRLWGCVLATSIDGRPLPEETAARLTDFTELVATAIANIEARAAVAASRARIVAATDEARRRFERDLHDGAQQRLVSLTLELRGVEAMTPPELTGFRAELTKVGDGITEVLDDLRELSRGLHPAILAEGGLAPALRALARRSAVPVALDGQVARRLDRAIEVAAYYVVSETLANASKHAHASKVAITVAEEDGTLVLTVADDGVGGADPARGSGLLGIIDRVEALGGCLTLDSPAGGGTEVRGRLPLAGDPPASRREE